MSLRRCLARGLTIVLGLMVFIAPAAYAAPGDVITIADPALIYSKAIATDSDSGVYWINPASNEPRVAAIGADGQVAGEVTFEAAVTEVEAMAYSAGFLYVGDIGDPALARSSLSVYRLEALQYGLSMPYSVWTLNYPDGPHHAKAMLISPRGNIYIITFGAPGGIYLAEVAGMGASAVTMVRVGDAPNWVTDAVFLDESRAALRSYTGVSVIDMYSFSATAQGAAPAQWVGEGLSLSLTGTGLIASSVGQPELTEVAVPQTWDESVPPPSDTPPGQGANEPTEEPSEQPNDSTPEPSQEAPEPQRFTPPSWLTSRSFWALAIAALVAGIVGFLAYRLPGQAPELRRRRRRPKADGETRQQE